MTITKEQQAELLRIIEEFPKAKAIVLGDIMLDHYLWCDVERISPEAPVPVAKVEKETNVLGGAANTAHNLASLDVSVSIVGVVGNDEYGKKTVELLDNKNINSCGVLSSDEKPTIVKTRIVCGVQQLLRVDRETTHRYSEQVQSALLRNLSNALKDAHVLIISDYSKGLLSEAFITEIKNLAGANKVRILADPKPSAYSWYENCYLLKPNKREAEEIAGCKFESDYSNMEAIGSSIQAKTRSNILLTLGKDGMALFRDNHVSRIKTTASDVYDVSGAGDTTLAALGASIAAGADLYSSAVISAFCAGIVVAKLGTATCTRQELIDRLALFANQK